MPQISAADNLVIEAEPTYWRILINTNFVDNIQGDGLLVEAIDGEPLRYTSVFARTRRLPRTGELATDYISRVVLGYSWEEEAWHLGFLLKDPLARARGSRWCSLAKWPDPELDLYRELAEQAGVSLARAVDRPFNFVPPKAQATRPATPIIPLPSLPLELQGWSLGRASQTNWLVFVRDDAWARERQRRIIWYSICVIVYVLLSVATMMSDIAPPRPTFLPYLGLATAVVLVGLVIRSSLELRNKARRIILDPTTRRIWGTTHKSGKPVWRMGREQIDSVYISEVVRPHTKGNDEDADEPIAADIHYSELNLRLTNGSYYFLLKQDEPETIADPILGDPDEVKPLKREDITTKLQGAAAYVSEALDVPLWYDYRLK